MSVRFKVALVLECLPVRTYLRLFTRFAFQRSQGARLGRNGGLALTQDRQGVFIAKYCIPRSLLLSNHFNLFFLIE
jgi:hypothetical protein